MKNKSEQWNHGGNCDKCRRKNYCGTPCKANKNRKQSILTGMVAEAFFKAMKGK